MLWLPLSSVQHVDTRHTSYHASKQSCETRLTQECAISGVAVGLEDESQWAVPTAVSFMLRCLVWDDDRKREIRLAT